MPKKQLKPEPVPVETVCSVCKLDWDRHGDNPTLEICIELLKADLAVKPPKQYVYPERWWPYERKWQWPAPRVNPYIGTSELPYKTYVLTEAPINKSIESSSIVKVTE